MTRQEKKKTTLGLGGAATLAAMMLNDRFTTEILVVGLAITVLAACIVENLAKEK